MILGGQCLARNLIQLHPKQLLQRLASVNDFNHCPASEQMVLRVGVPLQLPHEGVGALHLFVLG